MKPKTKFLPRYPFADIYPDPELDAYYDQLDRDFRMGAYARPTWLVRAKRFGSAALVVALLALLAYGATYLPPGGVLEAWFKPLVGTDPTGIDMLLLMLITVAFPLAGLVFLLMIFVEIFGGALNFAAVIVLLIAGYKLFDHWWDANLKVWLGLGAVAASYVALIVLAVPVPPGHQAVDSRNGHVVFTNPVSPRWARSGEKLWPPRVMFGAHYVKVVPVAPQTSPY